MDNWVPVSQKLPEDQEWAQVMTQDGTVFPAIYKAQQKVWSPIFRGGEVTQLYHGNVKFWQPHAEGYKMVACPDCGRKYLQSPTVTTCPICAAFKGATTETNKLTGEVKEGTDESIAQKVEKVINGGKKPARRGGRAKKDDQKL